MLARLFVKDADELRSALGSHLALIQDGPSKSDGIKLGNELRAVVRGKQSRDAALHGYAEFVDAHEWKFRWLLRAQRLLPRLPARVQRAVIRAAGRKRFVDWGFGHYLRIAPPEFAEAPPERQGDRPRVAAAA